MKFLIPFLVFVALYGALNMNIWSAAAISVWIVYLVLLLTNLNKSIAFREYIMMMYGMNYLFSPALTYEVTQQIAVYKMKLTPEEYFQLAIPAMCCLHAGLYSIKTKIFTQSLQLDKLQTFLNEKLLKFWLVGGIALGFVSSFMPGELAFVIYLLAGIRYIGALGLFVIDRKKYKWYLWGIFFMEAAGSLRAGMFHDIVIWILFISMVWTYINKPNARTKFVLGIMAVLVFYTLQVTKATYRKALGKGEEGGLTAFSEAVEVQRESGGFFGFSNFALSITRANQGWILASTMNNSNMRQNFQGTALINKYFEAAILPRFLAPNKLEAGDKGVFNEFSGARIAKYSSTSMGLGLFADGYVSYGYYGSLIFAFLFGFLCALIFKIIEKWSTISPLFVLFSFVLLNYAVRADCESQTWMGHIVKGLIVFSIVIYFTKRFFVRKSIEYYNNSAGGGLSPAPQLLPNTI